MEEMAKEEKIEMEENKDENWTEHYARKGFSCT